MHLLVKAHGYGTAQVEVEGTELTAQMAVQAAERVELEEFPGAEEFTVYEAMNVSKGRVFNVREKRELVASLVR